ncbi:MAG: hypothetical protein IRY95_07810 [Clostridia bacterium]|nr:hypothetical protein [Clostridia bacterium]
MPPRQPLDPRRYLPGGPEGISARSVLATFDHADQARAAAAALEREGFGGAQVDEVAWRPSEAGSLRDQPWPKTLTGEVSRDARGLAAEDPSVGGHALGGEHLIAGHHRYLLTVPLGPHGDADAVARIVRRHGGQVDTGGPR